MTPRFCQRLAEHVLPLAPAVRDLCRDVLRDIQQLLPLEQHDAGVEKPRARDRLKDQFYDTPQRRWPVLPWSWRLQYDFNQAMQPLRSLNGSFRKEILALATDEQRQAILSVIRPRADEHGLVVEDADRALLNLD